MKWEKKNDLRVRYHDEAESGIYEESTKGMWNLKWWISISIWEEEEEEEWVIEEEEKVEEEEETFFSVSFFLSNPQPATLPVSSTQCPKQHDDVFSLVVSR